MASNRTTVIIEHAVAIIAGCILGGLIGLFVCTALTGVASAQLASLPTLVGYDCDVGQGQGDLRTLYAAAEDDFPLCRRIEKLSTLTLEDIEAVKPVLPSR